jgi:peptide/nickel transport system substrate-binding protein
MKKLALLLVVLFAVGFAFAQEPEYLVTDYDGKPGGTLYLSTTQGPKTLNDSWAQETSSTDIIDIFLDALLDADLSGNPSGGGLAKDWWYSEDQKTVFFQIRDGLKWSDGEPFTIDDVVFTFKDIYFVEGMTANGPTGYVDSNDVLPEIEVVDDTTISFTWSTPSYWGFRAVAWTNILPEHKLGPAVENGTYQQAWTVDEIGEVVGMGPFIPVEYTEGTRVLLERNPHFYAVDKNGVKLPYLDRVIFQIVPDLNTELLKFEAGELDIYGPTAENFPRIAGQAEEKGWVVGTGGPVTGSSFVTINLGHQDPVKRSWFTNVHFRRALVYLLDRESIIETLYNGLGTPLYGPVPPSSGFYNPEIEEAFPYKYSIIRARLELRQGGFDWDNAGNLIDADGNRVEFNLSTNAGNNVREAIGNILVESASKVGMKINFRPMQFNTLVTQLTQPNYDAIVIGLTGGSDPGSGWNVWRLDGGLHFFNYSPELRPDTIDPETYKVYDWEKRIHEIYVESLGAFGEDRYDLFAEFQMLCAEYQPMIYTIAQNYLYAHPENVHLANPNPNPFAGQLWRMYGIWKD